MRLVLFPLWILFFVIPIIPHDTNLICVKNTESYLISKSISQFSILYLKTMDLIPWVTFSDQDSLRSRSVIICRMGILEKVSMYPSLTARKSRKDSNKFIIASVVWWVVTPMVFLLRSINTAGSSIFTLDKTWWKLMVKVLLWFHLKRCTLV